jgi:cytochrome c-type biogenesis protein CcmH/NrfF
LVLLAAGRLLRANRANGDPRLEKLYGQFMAPCCWAETLLVHSSPLAEQMRGEIQHWIAEGKTDDQIKAAFIERYGIRILSMPEGARLQWLFWTPIAAMTAGLMATLFTIRRLRGPKPGLSELENEPAVLEQEFITQESE